jgi:hypothetical protein
MTYDPKGKYLLLIDKYSVFVYVSIVMHFK